MIKNNQNSKRKNPDLGAEIISIGTELLLGNITNTNSRWIAEELAFLGIPHYRQTVIGDNYLRLSEAINEASNRSQILITTGGLGATPDDITNQTIASVFNTDLEEKKSITLEIKEKTKNTFLSSESIRKQASIPKGSEIIPNPLGLAPGIIWSPKPGFTIMTFPGVPEELKEMWKNTAIPWFKNHKISNEIIASKVLRFTGINESNLAEKFSYLMNNKNPTVAPYASLGEVKLRITAKSTTEEGAQSLIKPIEKELVKKAGIKYYGSDKQDLASTIIEILKERKETLAVAESCTGGGLGAALTSIPGSSEVFLGGIIAYNNFVKEKFLNTSASLIKNHGSVSPQVVEAMAEGAKNKFKADWAIAISGIAGPSGGEKEKPIGLVQFCISGRNSLQTGNEKFGSYRDRKSIQKLSVLKALDRLRLLLLAQS